jgi:hypothetical protein
VPRSNSRRMPREPAGTMPDLGPTSPDPENPNGSVEGDVSPDFVLAAETAPDIETTSRGPRRPRSPPPGWQCTTRRTRFGATWSGVPMAPAQRVYPRNQATHRAVGNHRPRETWVELIVDAIVAEYGGDGRDPIFSGR